MRFLSLVWAFGRLITTYVREGPFNTLITAARCGTSGFFLGEDFFQYRHLFEV